MFRPLSMIIACMRYSGNLKFLADLLAEHLPNCINFKRRKLCPGSSKYIAKYFFYCSIAGGTLDSTTYLTRDKMLHLTRDEMLHLTRDKMLHLHNKNTSLSHVKGVQKSYRSRSVRGDDRMKVGQSVSDLPYPSKEFHKRLANLEEISFSMGNLKDNPMSKNILKQCSYE